MLYREHIPENGVQCSLSGFWPVIHLKLGPNMFQRNYNDILQGTDYPKLDSVYFIAHSHLKTVPLMPVLLSPCEERLR